MFSFLSFCLSNTLYYIQNENGNDLSETCIWQLGLMLFYLIILLLFFFFNLIIWIVTIVMFAPIVKRHKKGNDFTYNVSFQDVLSMKLVLIRNDLKICLDIKSSSCNI